VFLVGDPTGLSVIALGLALFAHLFLRFRLETPREEGVP